MTQPNNSNDGHLLSICQLPASINDAFGYHQCRGALDRLLPPSERVKIVKRLDSIDVGAQVTLRMKLGLIPIDWTAEHTQFDPPNYFQDQQLSGPFHCWKHDHRFFAKDIDTTELKDEVAYQISRFRLLSRLMQRSIAKKLESMFAYRHRVCRADLILAKQMRSFGRRRIIISGASGMIGQRIAALASVLGHDVIGLRRVANQAALHSFDSAAAVSRDELIERQTPWDTKSGQVRKSDWKDIDAIIHLAGAGIADHRWTKNYKKKLYDSRVQSTQKLFEFLQHNDCLPKCIVTASGSGIYADSADQMLDESTVPGTDFLGDLAFNWENASRFVQSDNARWCAGRLGVVLDPLEGALVPLIRQFSLFSGGVFGNGRTYWSWIERDDAASALLWLACNENCSGPFNLSGEAVTNAQFAATLGKVMHRPNWCAIPSALIRTAIGEMADALLLRSNRLSNKKIVASGYPFRFGDLHAALSHLLPQ